MGSLTGSDLVQESVRIRADVKRAEEAFLDAAKLRTWLAREVQTEGKVGAPLKVAWGPKEARAVKGRVFSIEPALRIGWEWVDEKNPKETTVVLVHFHKERDVTRVVVVHSGFAADAKLAEAYARIWAHALGMLRARLEGDEGPFTDPFGNPL